MNMGVYLSKHENMNNDYGKFGGKIKQDRKKLSVIEVGLIYEEEREKLCNSILVLPYKITILKSHFSL